MTNRSSKTKHSTVPPPESGQKNFDPLEFARKMTDVMEQARPAIAEMLARIGTSHPSSTLTDTPIDPFSLHRATAEFWGHYLRHPSRLPEMQMKYIEDMSHLWQKTTEKFLGTPSEPIAYSSSTEMIDRRFRDPVWHDNATFDFLRQSYLLTRNWVQSALDDAYELSHDDRRKLEFYTRQFLDALAPTNFAATNPEVIRETLRTGGDNLIKGLQNLIDDIKNGQGELKISTTKYSNFKVGKNLATTSGQVIFRNSLIELIHYAPKMRQVHEIPLLIISPWINKYYILDLTPEKSLVQFALSQGLDVFIISWINPDRTYSNICFENYMRDGLLTALDVVEEITATKTTNVVGYCIGGTLTTMTMAWLARKKQSYRINSATLLTTLIDFDQAGDMKVFIDEKQLDELDLRMQKQGFLEAAALQKTFSILRANDMIWSFVINNYMMGREPFPFDILYWNEDSTNLPAAFHSQYLRHMYLRNDLIKPGVLNLNGIKIDITTIQTPIYFLSTREDHIAPWIATFSGAKILARNNPKVKFVLAASGHVAGIVNPPTAQKYGFWTQKDLKLSTEEWFQNAKYNEGSWWKDWSKWIKGKSGKKKPAPRTPGSLRYPPKCEAPGTYVMNGRYHEDTTDNRT